MSGAKHTPAPWKRGDCDRSIIWAKRFHSTGRTEGPAPDAVSIGYGFVSRDWMDRVFLTEEEREALEAENQANLDVMAAAPDLLEALQSVLAEWREGYGLICIDQVRAAIAKAEGRAP